MLYEGEAFVQEEDIPDFKVMVKEWGVRKQLKIKKRSSNQSESAIVAASPLEGPVSGSSSGSGPGAGSSWMGSWTGSAMGQSSSQTVDTPPRTVSLSCDYCDKTFCSRRKLNLHLLKKTFSLEEIDGELDNLIEKKENMYQCFICPGPKPHIWKCRVR